MRRLKAWWRIVSAIGSGMKAGREGDRIFRYYLINALDSVGLFDFLREPRTYGDILANFGFVDNEYTRDLISTLCMDKQNVIFLDNGLYQRKMDVPLPSLDVILANTPRRIHDLTLIGEGLYDNILDRLCEKDRDVDEVFERDDDRLVDKFNRLLGSEVYSAIRAGSFDFLTARDRRWLQGKQLLEMGCGNGVETAEIWLLTEGKINITGVDLVPSMLDLAVENFEHYLDKMDPDHPELTDANRPKFEVGDIIDLPYDSNSFQACYSMLVVHWTPDPRRAIREMIRVTEPGGLIFGAQAMKPYVNPYLNLLIRSSRNSYGFFWKDDLVQWFREFGLEIEMATPAGIFRVMNTAEASDSANKEASLHGANR